MDRQTVEEKDRDVVKKFRLVVEGKEKKKNREKSRLKLLLGMALACSLAIWLFVDYAWQHKPPVLNIEKTEKMDLSIPESSGDAFSAKPGQPEILQTGKADLLDDPPANTLPPDLISPKFPKKAKDFDDAKLVMLESKKISPKATQKKTITDAVKISKILPCREVMDKQCAATQNEFSVKRDGNVYVWMDVRSKQLPQKIRHIYFVNGRRYRSIPLSIKYPQMRTWSGISLNGAQDVGKWRVDVVSEQGQTLSHIEFRVVP
ncbi:MAG: DUF2914 domain-containing protein [Desulfobacterales bacterium]|jgi:hypothetical protein|nr:DUF2914 domain-containing protein [Desulfobacterales bacterium]